MATFNYITNTALPGDPSQIVRSASYLYVRCDIGPIHALTFDGSVYTVCGTLDLSPDYFIDMHVLNDGNIATICQSGSNIYLRTYSFDGTYFTQTATSASDINRRRCVYTGMGPAVDTSGTSLRLWNPTLTLNNSSSTGTLTLSADVTDWIYVTTTSSFRAHLQTIYGGPGPMLMASQAYVGSEYFHKVRSPIAGTAIVAGEITSSSDTGIAIFSYIGGSLTRHTTLHLPAGAYAGDVAVLAPVYGVFSGTYIIVAGDYGIYAYDYSGGTGGVWTAGPNRYDDPSGLGGYDMGIVKDGSYLHVVDGYRLKAYEYVTSVPPVADFSGTPTVGVVPLSVQLTDESTNTPTSWLWDFGDGATGAEQNPLHQYASSGSYTVSLEATNVGGSDIETKAGYIMATDPQIVPTASVKEGITPLSVSFDVDVLSGDWVSFAWDFGDGQSSNNKTVTHTYNSTGYHTVILVGTKTDASTETIIRRAWIRIGKLAFEASPSTSDEIPLSVAFTNMSAAPTGYEFRDWHWDFGDVSLGSGLTGPVHIYGEYGGYNVTLSAKMAEPA